MRTFWDPTPSSGAASGGDAALAPGAASSLQIGARNAALRRQCAEIGQALDHLERLTAAFRDCLAPVAELAREFEACRDRLERTTARLEALE